MKYLIMVLYLVLTVSGLILYKKGVESGFLIKLSSGNLNLKVSLLSIAGLCCYVISFLIYMLIIPKFDLNFIFPILSGLSYVSIYLLSILVLKENVTVFGIIGSAFIAIGIFIANIGR